MILRSWKTFRRTLLGAVVLAVSIWAGANAAIVRRSHGKLYQRPADVPPRYVAIVLGAAVWRSGPSPILEDRLLTAKALLDAGRVQKLLVSGDHGRDHYDEVNAMRDWLVRHGVPVEKIFLDHAGFRTRDTMQRAARVFQVKDAVVVTQQFHLPRALYLAANAGIDAVGAIADLRPYQSEAWNDLRESVARTSAFLEVNVWGPKPRFIGKAYPITGDARLTHDK